MRPFHRRLTDLGSPSLTRFILRSRLMPLTAVARSTGIDRQHLGCIRIGTAHATDEQKKALASFFGVTLAEMETALDLSAEWDRVIRGSDLVPR